MRQKLQGDLTKNNLGTEPKWQKSPNNPSHTLELLQLERGISQGVIDLFGIDAHGQSGWCYPVGTSASRIKFYGAYTAKYAWLVSPLDAKLVYNIQNLPATGEIWIVNGEPVVWQMATADIPAICFFGETNIPSDLPKILHDAHIRTVHYAPDVDPRIGGKIKSHSAAWKLRELLEPVGITVQCYDLQAAFPDIPLKGDLGDALVQARDEVIITPAVGQAVLDHLMQHPLELDPDSRPARPRMHVRKTVRPLKDHHQLDDAYWDDAYQRWREAELLPAIQDALERSPRRTKKHYQCINPQHQDNNPSARISHEKSPDGIYICTCGAHALETVGRWLNIDPSRKDANSDFRRWEKDQRPPHLQVAKEPTTELSRILTSLPPSQHEYDMPFISDAVEDIAPLNVALVRSAIGTGKTELVQRLLKDHWQGSAIFITHRVALTENATDRLADLCFEFYKDMPTKHSWSLVKRLAITVNSLVHLPADHLPEVVIIDEVEQLLSSLALASIFKGASAINLLNRVQRMIAQAKHVICLDAHAGVMAYAWLRNIRPDVAFVNNHYQPKARQRPLTLFDTWDDAVTQLQDSLAPGKTSLAAMGSKQQATNLQQIATNEWGIPAEEIMLVTADTVDEQKTRYFLQHINDEIGQYQLVLYTTTMGTGVDIQAPVEAVFGIFDHKNLTAMDCLQMIGRARHAKHYYAYVPPDVAANPASTRPRQIVKFELDKAKRNHYLIDQRIPYLEDFSKDLDIADGQRDFLMVFGFAKAIRNGSRNLLQQHFVHLAEQEYHVQHAPTTPEPNSTIRQAMKDANTARKAATKQAVLEAEPISEERIRQKKAAGTYTQADSYGYTHWLIQQHYGVCDAVTYDHYDQGKLKRLLLFEKLMQPPEHAIKEDLAEIAQGLPIPKRKHAVLHLSVVRAVIAATWVSLEHAHDGILLSSLEGLMAKFIAEHERDLMRLGVCRSDRENSPLKVLRRLLSRVGLSVEEVRNCQAAAEAKAHGDKLYRISAGSLDLMLGLYHQRQDALQLLGEEEYLSQKL